MRNLEILTKFTNTLNLSEGEKIVNSCLDEFGHLLFVYTNKNALVIYKYTAENPADATLYRRVGVTDEIPIDLSPACLLTMDYI